jgi:hypothetical protein
MTPYSFRGGFVQDREVAHVIAQNDQLTELGSTLTKLMRRIPGTGKWGTFDIDWVATRPWRTSAGHFFCLGPQGRVFQSFKGSYGTETIDPTGQGAERSGDFLDLRQIGERMYACGMSRQVYRREGDNRWARADQGTVQPAGTLDIAGFTSMDGAEESDFYAVGFGGEIWRCHNGAWAQMDSPTNVVLQCVRMIAPDRLYACGQSGVILRGSGNRWKAVDAGKIEEDLWGIQLFKDSVYIASERAIYQLDKNDVPRPIKTGLAKGCTYRHLHANDGVMWSFGSKNVAWTDDGKKWSDVTP